MNETVNRPLPRELSLLRIIYLAIITGATVFLGVILFMAQVTRAPSPAAMDAAGLWTMSVAHVVMALGCYAAAMIVYRRLAGPGVLAGPAAAATDHAALTARAKAAIRSARIVRLALVEAPALTGITVCFMGVTAGRMAEAPALWANLVTYGVLAAFVAGDFPRADAIAREITLMLRPGAR